MERISGRIKRAWRHRRGKGRVAGAVMAAVLTLSTVLGALAPVAAYAVGGQAYLKMDHSITYGGGRQNTMARTATLDGQSHESYCMEPRKGGAYTGYVSQYPASVPNGRTEELRAQVWFGYGGPGFDPSMWPSTWSDGTPMNADRYRVLTHILVSDTYASDFHGATANTSESFKRYVDHWVLYDTQYGDGSNWANTVANKMAMRADEVPGQDVFYVYFMDLKTLGLGASAQQTLCSFTYYPNGYAQVQKVSASPDITDGNDMYSLEGAEFTFYDSDGSEVGTLTTDENGSTEELELPVGTYTVKETEVPEGYLAAPDQTVKVRSNVTTTVTFEDVPAFDPAAMLVGKFDGERTYTELEGNLPQGSASLAGAEFTVEYYDTLDYEDFESLKEDGVEPARSWVVRTDSDGYARLSNDYVVSGDELFVGPTGSTVLPRGTVVVYESKAPEGYLLNEDSLSFQKIQEEPTSAVITYNTPQVPEDVKRGGVAVQKLDAQTGMTPQGDADFSGITFSVINNNENSVIVNGVEYQPGETVLDMVTNESGYASSAADALPYGDYIIRETATNDGYLNTADDIYATVSEDGTVYDFTASDDVVRGGVEVYKSDIESDLGTPLGGASLDGTEFEIRLVSDEPVIVDGVTYYKGDVIGQHLVIKDGYAVTDAHYLPFGTYTLQEVKVGEGYNLTDGTAYEFSIREDGVIVNPLDDGEHDGHVHNQVKRGDLEFNKKADDNGNRLALVPFKVTSLTTGESHVVVTDENGYFSSASSWNAHTANTNGNDWAMDAAADEEIDSSQLDPMAGTWFGLTTEGTMVGADDSLGALPYDSYAIEELRCTNNKGYQLISTTVTVSRHGVTVDYGTLDDQPQGEVVISTNAYDPTDKDGSVMVGDVAIADKVTYSGLALGGQYKLVTTVVDAETGEAITVDGAPVSASSTFVAESTAGYAVVEMQVPTYQLGGKTITVFEELYQVTNGSDTLLAEHKDKDDVDQQLDVIAPEIGTTATDAVDGDKNVVTDGETTVVDTVSYANLIPGKEYTLTGTLMVKGYDEDGNVTEEALMDANGNVVTAQTTFTPEAASGTVDVTFTFDSSAIADGTELVAFESLERGDVELAAHADISDEAQTVTVHESAIGTIASDGLDGDKQVIADAETTITDTVVYTDVLPGMGYTMAGILVDRESGLPILTGENHDYTEDDLRTFMDALADALGAGEGNGTAVDMEALSALFEENADLVDHMVIASQAFTPEDATGTVSMDFSFDANAVIDRLSGETKDIVVFEALFKGSLDEEAGDAPVTVTTEANLENDSQTVMLFASGVGTFAVDKSDGDKTLLPGKDATITDTVTYTGLIPGKEYTLKATLYDKATGEPLSVNDKRVTAELKFTPNSQNGTIDIDLGPFDASSLNGHELVVFEELYKQVSIEGEATDTLVAEHKDIEDQNQTVTVTNRPVGSTYGKTGGNDAAIALAILVLLALAGGFTAYGLKVRRTAKAEDSVEDTIAKPDNGSEE